MRALLVDVDARMVRKALRHPLMAIKRLVLRSRLARTPVAQERARLLAFLSHQFEVDGAALQIEFVRSDFSQWFRDRRTALRDFASPIRLGTTGEFGCEALYLLVRAARPQVVVETGVLYGAASAHILAALARNGSGKLHSIEIGRNPREPPHEYFVPDELQSRWDLVIGDSRQELPLLLRRYPNIDMFYHDSLHTFEHMTWEFETAFPHLRPGSVLSSDDVRTPSSILRLSRQNAFPTFCERRGVSYATFRNLGVGVTASNALAQ
jgi:predicted O-methyltransferase YrrM